MYIDDVKCPVCKCGYLRDSEQHRPTGNKPTRECLTCGYKVSRWTWIELYVDWESCKEA